MSAIARTSSEPSIADAPTQALLRPTRLLLVAFAVLTAVATNQLYVLSASTADYFAWTIAPALTAAVMGAGYAAGCLMVLLSLRARDWAPVRVVVHTVLVFTVLTLVATLVHLDKFHFGAAGIAGLAAWFWVGVYVLAPLAMIAVLVLEARVSRPALPASGSLPVALRWLAGVQSVVLIAVGAVMFVAPTRAAEFWPWDITPLTSRVLAAWVVALAVGLALTVRANDIAYAKLTALPYAVFGVLAAIALLRYASSVDWSSASAVALLVAVTAIITTGLWGFASSRSARGRISPR